ncbi:FKBP-type peptidyl-prolyl cis-trans isomerase [Pedobacter sp. Du54]|uniref:FKBP-type peptidyl-prolyl cis-trans isomerase n=1 Tax=Pedobacter anseongensis TaxID=3133439 RepID=UPI0030B12441
MKKGLIILFAASIALAACNKEQKGKGGLLYTVHKDAGNAKIKEGDFIKIDFIQKNDKDSVLDATYDHDQSRFFPVGKKAYAGDMNDVLTLFGEGDSVTFKINIDTMVFYNKQPRPEEFKDQKYLTYTIKIQKVLPKKPNEADSLFQKRANEFYMADLKATMDKKKAAEAGKMKKYVEDHNLKVTTTASGLQYVITEPGTGPKPVMGDTAMVDYVGQLTFGKANGDKMNVFDTSIEKVAKEHMTPNPMKQFGPAAIPLGEGIAKGFVEALQLIAKGGKITVIMPSKLGYGEQGGGPIPPYAPLVFDIELKDIKKGVATTPPAPVAPGAVVK